MCSDTAAMQQRKNRYLPLAIKFKIENPTDILHSHFTDSSTCFANEKQTLKSTSETNIDKVCWYA